MVIRAAALVAVAFVTMVSWSHAAPGTRPATKPATGMATRVVNAPALGLTVTVPDAWTTIETGGKGQASLTMRGIDDARTALGILRKDEPVPEADRATYVRREADRQREITARGNGKVIDDRDVQIAGTTGRLIEVENPAGEHPLRVLTVCFLLDGREYKLMLAARRDPAARVRPAVDALIESVRPLPATDKKNP